MGEVDRSDLDPDDGRPRALGVFPKVEVPKGEVVLDVKGLGCRASGVHDVSFQVREGEMLGLAGLIGAGRTELARVLFGLTPADSGSIVLDGEPVTIRLARRGDRDGDRLRPRGPPAARRDPRDVGRGERHAGDPPGDLEPRDARLRPRNARSRPTWSSGSGSRRRRSTRRSSNLSGGNQQKVALARWLNADPSVLILDEPTQGVDVGAKAEIHRLMGELAAKGMAIVMISSELPEILGMSDRIAVMHGGTIVGTLDRDGATQEAILELALGHSPAGSAVAS